MRTSRSPLGQAASVTKVGLVGLSSVTHDVDPGQRYVPLKFTIAGTTLTVTGPPSGGAAPPGYYMLFITDSSGVPSVARMVQVAKGPTPLMSPVKNSAAARCVDVPRSNLASRTYLQVYTCNNTKAQALTRFPADTSVRVLGNCLDVPSRHFVAGQQDLGIYVQRHDCADLGVHHDRHHPPDRREQPVPGSVGYDQCRLDCAGEM